MVSLLLYFLTNAAHAADSVPVIQQTSIAADANTGVSSLANFVIALLTNLAYPLAFVAIIYTAYIFITSMGKPDAYEKGKKNIVYLVIGLGLIIFSTIFIRLLVGFFK